MASAQLRKLLKLGVFPDSRQAFDAMLASLTPETMQGIDEALDAASGDKKLADAVSEAQSYLMTDPDDPSVGMQLLADQLYADADPPRKTGVRGKKDTPNETIEGNDLPQSSADRDALAPVPEEKPKRGRGRPKKEPAGPLETSDENMFLIDQGFTEDQIRKMKPADRSATLADLGFQPKPGSAPAPNQAAGSDAMQRAREMVSQQMGSADPDGSEIDPTALGAQMVDAADLPTEPPQAGAPAMDMSRLNAANFPQPASMPPSPMDMSRLSAAAPQGQPAMDLSRLAASATPPAAAPQSNMISMLSRYLRDQQAAAPQAAPAAQAAGLSDFEVISRMGGDPVREPIPFYPRIDVSSPPDYINPASDFGRLMADRNAMEPLGMPTRPKPDTTGGGGPPIDPPKGGKEKPWRPVSDLTPQWAKNMGSDKVTGYGDHIIRNLIPYVAGGAAVGTLGAAAFRNYGGSPQEDADAQAARMQELEEARQRVRESLGRINVAE